MNHDAITPYLSLPVFVAAVATVKEAVVPVSNDGAGKTPEGEQHIR